MSIPKSPPAPVNPNGQRTHPTASALRDKPWAAQPKKTSAPQLKAPAAPTVFRPQPTPAVLQPKTAGALQHPPPAVRGRNAPQAPPVYRPQPTPKVLQRKASDRQAAPPAGREKKTPAAPPVYRPQPSPVVLRKSGAVQLKPKAHPSTPPVYRPNAAPAVLQRKAARPEGGPPNSARRPTPAAPPVYRPQPTPKVLQKKDGPGPVIQRATLVLQEAANVDKGILKDAKRFHRQQGTGVFYNDHAQQALGELEKPTPKDTHVDIFGHGNAGEVGDYGEDALILRLKQLKASLKLKEIRSIAFHSCDSATPLSLDGATEELKLKYAGKEGTTLAERVAKKFLEENIYVEVSGFRGHTQTDLAGQSRPLIDPNKETEYKGKRDIAFGQQDWDEVRRIEDEYLQPLGDEKFTYGRDLMLAKIGMTGTSKEVSYLSRLQYEVAKEGMGQEYDDDALARKARKLFKQYKGFAEGEGIDYKSWAKGRGLSTDSQDYQEIVNGEKGTMVYDSFN